MTLLCVRRRLLLLLGFLLVAGVLGGGWYAYEKGFSKKWRGFVTNEFRKRGVEVSLRQLALDPVRGLVARDVRIYDTRDRRRTLAVIDEILLVINYANFFKNEPFIEALDLREARLVLPLDPKNSQGPAIEINRLSGHLLLPPQQIYLSRLDAEVNGVQISASGRLINPQAFRYKPSASGERPLIAVVERIIAELKAIKFEAEPPRLELRFSGDIAQPGQIFVEGSLSGKKVRREKYRLEELYLQAGYRDGVIEIAQLKASDAKGNLDASGRFEVATGQGSLRLRSDLDALAFAGAFGFAGPWEDFVAYGPPQFEFTAKAKLGANPSLGVVGQVAMPRFAYRAAVFESLVGDFSWKDGQWSARDIRLVHRTGEVRGDILNAPGECRAQFTSSINPRALGPVLTGPMAEALAQFEFSDSPEIEFKVHGSEPRLEMCAIQAQIKLGRSSFRNVAARSLVATVGFKERKLTIAPFQLERKEGSATGGVIVDFARDQVVLEKIRANVFPHEVMTWFAPELVQDVVPYRFVRKPPNLAVDGIVGTKEGKKTRLGIEIDAPTGFDHLFLKKNLSFPNVTGKLWFADDRLKITGVTAALFGGKLRGNADISLVREKPGHTVEMQLENVDFASVTKLYFDYETSKGRFDAVYNFTGAGDDPRAMRGRAEIAVRDGNVFAIPFLGPFSGILNSIVPGMGLDVAQKASGSFAVADGVINTDDLVVVGNGFSLMGNGKLMFVEDAIDFNVRINAHGLPGVLLFPVSKLFEYVSDEKLSKPKWRSKALPRL